MGDLSIPGLGYPQTGTNPLSVLRDDCIYILSLPEGAENMISTLIWPRRFLMASSLPPETFSLQEKAAQLGTELCGGDSQSS